MWADLLTEVSLVYFVEMYALFFAILHIREHHKPGSSIVASDIKSCLPRLENHIAVRAKKVSYWHVVLDMSYRRYVVKLKSIPSHCGIRNILNKEVTLMTSLNSDSIIKGTPNRLMMNKMPKMVNQMGFENILDYFII